MAHPPRRERTEQWAAGDYRPLQAQHGPTLDCHVGAVWGGANGRYRRPSGQRHPHLPRWHLANHLAQQRLLSGAVAGRHQPKRILGPHPVHDWRLAPHFGGTGASHDRHDTPHGDELGSGQQARLHANCALLAGG